MAVRCPNVDIAANRAYSEKILSLYWRDLSEGETHRSGTRGGVAG